MTARKIKLPTSETVTDSPQPPIGLGAAVVTDSAAKPAKPVEAFSLPERLAKAQADLEHEQGRFNDLSSAHQKGQAVIEELQQSVVDLEAQDDALLLELAECAANREPVGTRRKQLDDCRGRKLLAEKRLAAAESEAKARETTLANLGHRLRELQAQVGNLETRRHREIWERHETKLLLAARQAISDYFAIGTACGHAPRFKPAEAGPFWKRFLPAHEEMREQARKEAEKIARGEYDV